MQVIGAKGFGISLTQTERIWSDYFTACLAITQHKFTCRWMRAYALACQFIALFCQAVLSALCAASDLKNLLHALCVWNDPLNLLIVDAFPVYLNPDTSKQNQQDTWQADPIGENPLEELRDKPTQKPITMANPSGKLSSDTHMNNQSINISASDYNLSLPTTSKNLS
ncbi:hypothetical protein MJO29_016641 [Puccinia striiformis f. sp. tritici]|nr:hypothetical protein MJO29_016641 [Puccinia striiformis f. sp. tritici]